MINYLIFGILFLILGVLIYLLISLKNKDAYEKGGNENLENNSTKNVVVHDSLDGIDEPLKRAKIIGDIPEEVTFDVEKNE